MDDPLGWLDLTPELCKRLMGSQIIAVRGDGKMYVGTVVECHPAYVKLVNGNQSQNLVHSMHRYSVATFEPPPVWSPKMAHPSLL